MEFVLLLHLDDQDSKGVNSEHDSLNFEHQLLLSSNSNINCETCRLVDTFHRIRKLRPRLLKQEAVLPGASSKKTI